MVDSEFRDDHHVFNRKVEWAASLEGSTLREAVVARDMLRSYHERLHKETSPVPVPLFHSLQFVACRFKPRGDVFDRIEQVQELLDKANDMRYVKPIEVELNLLCMDALEAQIPHIQDGLPGATVIDLGQYRGNPERFDRGTTS